MKLRFPFSFGQLVCLLLAAVPGAALAQSVGVGTTTPHPSAALEVASTGKGLLLPRLTQAQRTAIAGPAPGLIVYQTDGAAGFWYYSGTQWLPLQGSGSADNLGNHTATQNLQLGTNLLVGNGGTSGLAISNNGNVGIGTSSPTQTLHVAGGARVTNLGAGTGTGTRLVLAAPDGTLSTSESPTTGTLTGPQPRSTLMSTTALTGVPVAVAMSGSRTYTLTTTAFQIIDNSDPAAPVLLSNTPLPGLLGRALDVRGSLLAIVGNTGSGLGGNRLLLYDVADPAAPALRSHVTADGSEAVALGSSGTRAYVLTRFFDFVQVFDITNANSPAGLGGFSFGGVTPMRMAVNGTIGYVVNAGNNSLHVLDLNTPGFPNLLGTIGTNNSPSDVVVSGTTAYVVNAGSSTLQVFDVSNPSLPVLRGSVGTMATPTGVVAVGRNLVCVISSGSQTLQTFDVSNPALPVLQGTIGTNAVTADVAASGTIAYVLTQLPSLQAFLVQSAPGMLIGQNPNGGVVGILPADLADNLGNHTATRNLQLGTNLLTGNGGTSGLAVAANGQVQVTTAGGWIATNVGASTGDRVVSGLLDGVPTIGGHNNALTAWAPLALNPGGGNVGIGTSAPAERLHVVGNARVIGSLRVNSTLDAGNTSITGFLDVRGAGGLRAYTSNPGTGAVDWFNAFGGVAGTAMARVVVGTHHGTATIGGHTFNSSNNPINWSTLALNPGGGNVGIGTDAPTERLHVAGNLKVVGNLKVDEISSGFIDVRGTGGIRAYTTNPGSGISDWFSAFGGVAGTAMPRVVVGTLNGVATLGGHGFDSGNNAIGWRNLALNPDGGNVGIGTNAPGEKLHVIGNAYVQGNVTLTGQFTSAGPVSFCGGAYTCSDRRYKKDITPLRSALENVLKLNGYTYFWKQAAFPEKKFTADRQLGFIAQEVEALYPEMVMTDPQTGYKSVDYAKMTPVLLEALKEQQRQIDALRAEAAAATTRAARAEASLDSFESRLRALETGGAHAGR